MYSDYNHKYELSLGEDGCRILIKGKGLCFNREGDIPYWF